MSTPRTHGRLRRIAGATIATGLAAAVASCSAPVESSAAPSSASSERVASTPTPSASPSASPTPELTVIASASPEASPSEPGGLQPLRTIVFGDGEWRLTPRPSWEQVTDGAILEAVTATLASMPGRIESEFVGMWHPRGSEDDLVYVARFEGRGQPTANDIDAFLDAQVDTMDAAGLEATASPIDWRSNSDGSILDATLTMEYAETGSVRYEVIEVKRLESSMLVAWSYSSHENAALMAAWAVRDQVRKAPPAR